MFQQDLSGAPQVGNFNVVGQQSNALLGQPQGTVPQLFDPGSLNTTTFQSVNDNINNMVKALKGTS